MKRGALIVIAHDPGAGARATTAVGRSIGRGHVPLSANYPAASIQQILNTVEPVLIERSYQTASRMADILAGHHPLLRRSHRLGYRSWVQSPAPTSRPASLRRGNDI